MEKFKTVNNSICKQIVFQCVENFNHAILTRQLFNAIDLLSDKVWLLMFKFCVESGYCMTTDLFVDNVGIHSCELIHKHKTILRHYDTISNKKNMIKVYVND